MKKIILAGGCFWGVEAYFSKLDGVTFTKVGYIDGFTENPSYKDVCDGSGHAEAVWVEYDKQRITLVTLLKHFFRVVDTTQINRQGNDIGVQYRNAIYYFDKKDKETIETFIEGKQESLAKKVQTQVLKASKFYDAEEYHQNYLEKNPGGYCHIDLSLLRDIIE